MAEEAAAGAWFTPSAEASATPDFVPPAQRTTAFVMPGFGIGGKRSVETQSAAEVAQQLAAEGQPAGSTSTDETTPKKQKLAETITSWGPLTEEDAKLPVKPHEANGHHLHTAGAMVFCAICGAYGKGAVKKLHMPCAGPPKRKERLNRLAVGKDPVEDVYLGSVRRTVRGDVAALQ